MTLTWTLWLTTNRALEFQPNRAHTNASQLQNIIRERTGRKLSLRALHTLLESQPTTIDISILQAICDAFQCKLDDFCSLTPSGSSESVNLQTDLRTQFSDARFSPLAGGETLKDRQNAHERWHISYALNMTSWKKAAAARLLGLSRPTLYKKLLALQIPPEKPSTHSSCLHDFRIEVGNDQISPLMAGETLKHRQNVHERWHISYALNKTGWNKAAAARLLGLSCPTLREKMVALDIPPKTPSTHCSCRHDIQPRNLSSTSTDHNRTVNASPR